MKSPKRVRVKILIGRCTLHGSVAVIIGDTRVTPEKCCGKWVFIHDWIVLKSELHKAIDEAYDAAP